MFFTDVWAEMYPVYESIAKESNRVQNFYNDSYSTAGLIGLLYTKLNEKS